MLFLPGLEIRKMELCSHFIKAVDDNPKTHGNHGLTKGWSRWVSAAKPSGLLASPSPAAAFEELSTKSCLTKHHSGWLQRRCVHPPDIGFMKGE